MLHEVKFASSNGRDEVTGWIYVPACEPTGIVQLVHGFGEHSRRYFHMIVALMDAGFIVAANDHVGHGESVAPDGTRRFFAEKNGNRVLLEDMETVRKTAAEKYPDVPYFSATPWAP